MNRAELSDEQITVILKQAKCIAVIGCSDQPDRTSFQIAHYLQRLGYRIIPVNPNIQMTLGETSYETIYDIPYDIEVDIVDIFRNREFTTEMVKEIVAWSKKTGQKPLIWTQLGVSTDEAAQLADENGLDYIADRCIMVEHRKFIR